MAMNQGRPLSSASSISAIPWPPLWVSPARSLAIILSRAEVIVCSSLTLQHRGRGSCGSSHGIIGGWGELWDIGHSNSTENNKARHMRKHRRVKCSLDVQSWRGIRQASHFGHAAHCDSICYKILTPYSSSHTGPCGPEGDPPVPFLGCSTWSRSSPAPGFIVKGKQEVKQNTYIVHAISLYLALKSPHTSKPMSS